MRVFIAAVDGLGDLTTSRNLPTVPSSMLPPSRQWPSSHCCQPNSSAFTYLVTRPRYNNILANGSVPHILGISRARKFSQVRFHSGSLHESGTAPGPSAVCHSYHIVTHAHSHTFAFTLAAYGHFTRGALDQLPHLASHLATTYTRPATTFSVVLLHIHCGSSSCRNTKTSLTARTPQSHTTNLDKCNYKLVDGYASCTLGSSC